MIACHSLISRPASFPAQVATLALLVIQHVLQKQGVAWIVFDQQKMKMNRHGAFVYVASRDNLTSVSAAFNISH
jgi:hypothetical protein